jgi:hypothetical protein
MGIRHSILAFIGFMTAVTFSGAARAADLPSSDDQMARLADTLSHVGASATLTASAAEKFGLGNQNYPEKFVEISKSDGTLRTIEVVSDGEKNHIFFSEKTRAELITVHSASDGEFIMGFQRSNDSDDGQELSGNQGRTFLETEKAYWLIWLAAKGQ